jgi:ribosomal protein L7/L12
MDDDTSDEIAALIRQGRKVEAIKLLRESTGVDLTRAKEEIDRLSKALSERDLHETESAVGMSEEVRDLARRGERMQAVTLHREQAGLGMKEAREQVDEVMKYYGRKPGCFATFMLLSLVACAAWLFTVH